MQASRRTEGQRVRIQRGQVEFRHAQTQKTHPRQPLSGMLITLKETSQVALQAFKQGISQGFTTGRSPGDLLAQEQAGEQRLPHRQNFFLVRIKTAGVAHHIQVREHFR